MMKKKVVSIVLALALILGIVGIAPLAQADLPDIDPNADCSITVVKYLLGRLSDANPEGTGEVAGTGHGPAPSIPAGATVLGGIDFKVTKMVPAVSTDLGAVEYEGSWYAPDTINPYTATITTNASGIAKFGVSPALKVGIYYVEELASPLVTDPAEPFFVSLPTAIAGPSGTLADGDYIYDVFAYPKNEDLKITKTLADGHMDDTFSYEETITWKISADVPTDIKKAKKYDIVDSYDPNLSYVTGSVVVTPIKSAVAQSPLTLDTHYEVTPGTNEVTISFIKQAGLDALHGCEKVEITLQTKIKAGSPLGQPFENVAELQYQNRFYGDPKYPTHESHETTRGTGRPKVHTGGFRFHKIDSVDGESLEGATFRLVKKNPLVAATDYAAYQADLALYGFLTKADGSTYTSTATGSNGYGQFVGIPYGEHNQPYNTAFTDYWLVEITAPDGYRLPGGAPAVVRVNSTSYNASDPGQHYDVENVKGFKFPLTGGIGTVLFILAGLALAGLSAVLFKASKPKEEYTVL